MGDGNALLDWAVSRGRVSQVGFSSHGDNGADRSGAAQPVSASAACTCIGWIPSVCPWPVGPWTHGLGVMAISPADKGGRLQAPSPTLMEDCTPFAPLELAYRFLLAPAHQRSRWRRSREGSSARRNPGAGRRSVSQAEQQALEHGRAKGGSRNGCQPLRPVPACLPCPKQVPIPELLRLRNLAIGHGLTEFAQERYNLIGRAGHWWEEHDASACERCGECLPRCPHHLPIPDLLADTHQRLKASPRRRLWS